MTQRVELEFGLTGWRDRFRVMWSALRRGKVLMVMSEDAFYNACALAMDAPTSKPE